MIVACDTFDYRDFPVYVEPGQNPREVADKYKSPDKMLRLMEVYDLRAPKIPQLQTGVLVFNYGDDFPPLPPPPGPTLQLIKG